jgi:hypothetical protein
LLSPDVWAMCEVTVKFDGQVIFRQYSTKEHNCWA